MDDFSADIAAIERIDAVPLILDVICRSTGMGFAAVARVTDERWIACAVKDNIDFGLPVGGELPVKSTICDEIRDSGHGVIFDDADSHPIYCSHHTPALYGLKSYISLPIVLTDGTFFGTLCAVDPRPHTLNTPETIGLFKLFAEMIALHLTNRERIAGIQDALQEARRNETLREQFVAVLGHDLRNPLGAIVSGTELLKGRTSDSRGEQLVAMIQQSATRMGELVENLLDLARGRLGGGLKVKTKPHDSLEPVIAQAVAELRAAWPDRAVVEQFDFAAPVTADGDRIAQMVSNLLGNAFTHGDPTQPVRVIAASRDDIFVLSVSNGGAAICPKVMTRLFQPFARGEVLSGQEGLGLGLYIAQEIARAHGGNITVKSDPIETRFTFTMPL